MENYAKKQYMLFATIRIIYFLFNMKEKKPNANYYYYFILVFSSEKKERGGSEKLHLLTSYGKWNSIYQFWGESRAENSISMEQFLKKKRKKKKNPKKLESGFKDLRAV